MLYKLNLESRAGQHAPSLQLLSNWLQYFSIPSIWSSPTCPCSLTHEFDIIRKSTFVFSIILFRFLLPIEILFVKVTLSGHSHSQYLQFNTTLLATLHSHSITIIFFFLLSSQLSYSLFQSGAVFPFTLGCQPSNVHIYVPLPYTVPW